MRMMPYMNGKMWFGTKSADERRVHRMDGIIGLVIVVAIALAIIGGLAGTVGSGITAQSNSTAISGWSTWSSQAQSNFTGTANNMSLAWFLLPLLLIVG